MVLYSIAEIGRFLQSEPGGHCLTQKPFFSFLLNDTGHGVSIHVKSPSRLKHIRPKNSNLKISMKIRKVWDFGDSKVWKHQAFRWIDISKNWTFRESRISMKRYLEESKFVSDVFITIYRNSGFFKISIPQNIDSSKLWTRREFRLSEFFGESLFSGNWFVPFPHLKFCSSHSLTSSHVLLSALSRYPFGQEHL